MSPKTRMWVRAVIDYGPLIGFLAATQFTGDAITASLVIVPVSLVSLAAAWVMERRIAPMPLVAGLMALPCFGQGMTKGIISPPANVRPPGLQNVGIEHQLGEQWGEKPEQNRQQPATNTGNVVPGSFPRR